LLASHRKSLEDIEIEYHQANASYKVAEKQIEEQAASLKVGYQFQNDSPSHPMKKESNHV
jgi:hypothetical protein